MASSTAPEPRRPSIITKRTHIRNQKHENDTNTSAKQPTTPSPTSTTPPTTQKHQTTPRIFDSLLAGLGYASLTYYILRGWHRHTLTTYELASLSLSTFTIGFGLFDLGKRMGMIAGSSSTLRADDEHVFDESEEKEAAEAEEEKKEQQEEEDEEAWKRQFKGREFEDLDDKEKIEWLRLEGDKIRDVQGEEELRCGRAYIAKEQAYVEYERFGGYGGSAWKRYADADVECQTMYNEHQKQQKRLKQIGTEINELQESI